MPTKIQLRRDTATNWTTTNPILASGEKGLEIDTGKEKNGDGVTAWNSLNYIDSIYEKIDNRIYEGMDLSTKFSSEIAGYSDAWAWIKARIQAGNFTGIHIGDYIPFTMNAGTVTDGTTPYTFAAQSFQAQIAGIDTYYGCGGTPIGHHIDFITKTVIDTIIPWQATANNNGTAIQANPWLSSKLYAILNGVNNYTTSAYNSVAHGYALTSGSVLSLLPSALQNVIVTKLSAPESRYSSSGLLTTSTNWVNVNMGKLWLPNEFEVYGAAVWSTQNWANSSTVQYPLFANAMGYRGRLKINSSGSRRPWGLSTVSSSDSTSMCQIDAGGNASYVSCSSNANNAPLCFRID